MMNFLPGMDLPVPDPARACAWLSFAWLLGCLRLAWAMRRI